MRWPDTSPPERKDGLDKLPILPVADEALEESVRVTTQWCQARTQASEFEVKHIWKLDMCFLIVSICALIWLLAHFKEIVK